MSEYLSQNIESIIHCYEEVRISLYITLDQIAVISLGNRRGLKYHMQGSTTPKSYKNYDQLKSGCNAIAKLKRTTMQTRESAQFSTLWRLKTICQFLMVYTLTLCRVHLTDFSQTFHSFIVICRLQESVAYWTYLFYQFKVTLTSRV